MSYPTTSEDMYAAAMNRQQVRTLDAYERAEREKTYEPMRYLLEVADQLGSGGGYHPPDPVRERASLQALQLLLVERIARLDAGGATDFPQQAPECSQAGTASPEKPSTQTTSVHSEAAPLPSSQQSPPGAECPDLYANYFASRSKHGSAPENKSQSSSPSSDLVVCQDPGFDEGGNAPAGGAP